MLFAIGDTRHDFAVASLALSGSNFPHHCLIVSAN